jgi:hypothetical protein
MRIFLPFVLALLGCSDSESGNKPGNVDTSSSQQSADSGKVNGDSGVGDTAVEPPPAVAGMPAGMWVDCRGSLGLNASGSWAWRDANTDCVAEGMATLDAGVLSFSVLATVECDGGVPWWTTSEDDGPGTHTFSTTDIRLTLVPDVAMGSSGSASHREKHFYGQLFRERWLLTNDAGDQSHFDACFSPERVFFEGRYTAVDDSCDFLSCGGAINEWRTTEAEQLHIWTQCAGECPCAGVLQTSSMDETEIEGVYGYSNCGMSGTGTFTGTQVAFPDGDAR